MVKFISCGSGSSGNCYYFATDGFKWLVDLGVGYRTIKKRLAQYGESPDNASLILITHDHVDHIKQLGSFTKKNSLPVVATPTLHNAFKKHPCSLDMPSICRRDIELYKSYTFGPLTITAFELRHDATQTIGYHMSIGNNRITLITDTGSMPEIAYEFAQNCDTLIIESNYDMDMLLSGGYPYDLKMRIINEETGHLSNEQCAEVLAKVANPGLKNVFLCHLSEENNTPQLAYGSALTALSDLSKERGLHNPLKLNCLPRREVSQLFTL